ncbi:transmembrane emp24 domain-containing protein p24beta2 [Tanacetum coccineum]
MGVSHVYGWIWATLRLFASWRGKLSDEDTYVVVRSCQHIKPLFDQIAKLEEALYNIQFEQHRLQAENDCQAIVNKKNGKASGPQGAEVFMRGYIGCKSFDQVMQVGGLKEWPI